MHARELKALAALIFEEQIHFSREGEIFVVELGLVAPTVGQRRVMVRVKAMRGRHGGDMHTRTRIGR